MEKHEWLGVAEKAMNFAEQLRKDNDGLVRVCLAYFIMLGYVHGHRDDSPKMREFYDCIKEIIEGEKGSDG